MVRVVCSFALRSRETLFVTTQKRKKTRVFVVWRQNRRPFFE
jgi:hypothetical protein